MTTPDDDARRRVHQDLGSSLVVSGAPGTGRTQVLVERAAALVKHGHTRTDRVVIVSADDAGAADVRARLEAVLPGPGSGHRAGAPRVVTVLDLARGVLDDHATHCAVAPGYVVLDAAADQTDFDDRWHRFADALFEDDGARLALIHGFSLGLDPEGLRAVANGLFRRRDHLAETEEERATNPAADAAAPVVAPVDVRPVLRALAGASSMQAWCDDPADLLYQHLGALKAAHDDLAALEEDDQAVLQYLDARRPFTCALGQQGRWSGHAEEVRTACEEAERVRRVMLEATGAGALSALVARLGAFVVGVVGERRLHGRLGERDVLMLARQLLRSDPAVGAAVAERWACVLVDALDDDLEAEVAALVFEAVARNTASDGQAGSVWTGARADGPMPALLDELPHVHLTVNQRAVPGIVRFVHALAPPVDARKPEEQATHEAFTGPVAGRRAMALVWRPSSGAGGRAKNVTSSVPASLSSEPAQLALGGLDPPPSSEAPAGAPPREGPRESVTTGSGVAPVVVVGGAMRASASDVRRALARGVADAVVDVVTTGWAVSEHGVVRRATWRDVAVLLPSSVGFSALEEALDGAGVPLHTEDAALAWASEDVRDVLAFLAAADDPTDELAVLTALRTPALGCGDDDLVTWRRGGGTWDASAAPCEGFETHPVATAMALVTRLHEARWWHEPSALVSMALAELSAFALCLAHPHPDDHMRRLRFLVERARHFDDTTGGSLRAFLTWASHQVGGTADPGGTGPPDADADAVRMMTTGAAAGLEFPVVVMAGLEEDDGPRAPVVLWGQTGPPEIRASRGLRSAGYDDALARRRQRHGAPSRHLLTAMLRARDHLVVCAHHREREVPVGVAPGFVDACARNPHLWRRLPVDAAVKAALPVPTDADPAPSADVDAVWRDLRATGRDDEAAAWEREIDAFVTRRRAALEKSRAHHRM